MADLVFFAARPERDAADGEYASFVAALGIGASDLDSVSLLDAPVAPEQLARYKGIMVGGSPFNFTDAEKSPEQVLTEANIRAIADFARETGTYTLFSCYGIGVVAAHLGGEVSDAHVETALTPIIALTADAASDPVFGTLPAEFIGLGAHHESVARLPEGAVLLAASKDCPQSYRVGDNIYTTQFHPELTGEAFARRMGVYRSHGYFSDAEYESLAADVRQVDAPHPATILRNFAALALSSAA